MAEGGGAGGGSRSSTISAFTRLRPLDAELPTATDNEKQLLHTRNSSSAKGGGGKTVSSNARSRNGKEESCVTVDEANKIVTVVGPDYHQQSGDNAGAGVEKAAENGQTYDFALNGVLENCSQEDMFNSIARDICDSVLEGFNGTVLAYGQTGAGKTYSMMGGTATSFEERGIVPRAMSYMFRKLGLSAVSDRNSQGISADDEAVIRVSYVEIYNEQPYDLLALKTSEKSELKPGKLTLLENADGEILIRGLKRPVIRNETEALEWFFEGETNRAIAEHALNKASSRSHCVFSVYLERKGNEAEDVTGHEDESRETKIHSKMHFVDLAGSERVSKTHSSGDTLMEAKHINKSLSFLEQVVLSLVSKRSHVPYRSSKLTHMLQDSLGGNCKTRLLACIRKDKVHCLESIATLRFATRMMHVKTRPVRNVVTKSDNGVDAAVVTRYEQEIQLLKKELAMYDSLNGRTGVSYEPTSEAERNLIKEMVHSYAFSKTDQEKEEAFTRLMGVSTMRQVACAFEQFRSLFHECRDSRTNGSNESTWGVPASGCTRQGDERSDIEVQSVSTQPKPASQAESRGLSSQGSNHDAEDVSAKFKQWVQDVDQGKMLHGDYVEVKKNLKLKKDEAKKQATLVNECKRSIDYYTRALNGKNEKPNDTDNTALAEKLQEYKEQYRQFYAELEEKKSELQYLTGSMKALKSKMLGAYEEWLRQESGTASTDKRSDEDGGDDVDSTAAPNDGDGAMASAPYENVRELALKKKAEKEKLRNSNQFRKEWQNAL